MTIQAIEENYLGHDYTSGRLNTTGKISVKYGRIEASIKLPIGQGLWPAFWMLPEDWVYGGWPNSGEIDIMELLGQQPETIYGTLHVGQPYSSSGNNYTITGTDFSQDFHEFAIEWEENEIRWYVDDILYSTKGPGDIAPWAPFQEEFHLLLNVAVGGNWPGSPDGSTVFPQTMEVDYVRIYKDISEVAITGDTAVFPNQSSTSYSLPELIDGTYSWNVPAGASIVSGQGTGEIVVDWGCSGGDITVDITTSCGTETISLNVNVNGNAIEDPGNIYNGQENVSFIVSGDPADSYTWTVPPGATITAGQGTPSILVDWGNTGGLVDVEVINSCGTFNYSWNVIPGPINTFCDFDNIDLYFIPFGGNTFDEINNPQVNGINTSQRVGESISGWETWAGIFADLGGEIDFSLSSELQVKVWSPIICDLVFKLEDHTGPAPDVSITQTVPTANEWVEYTFDFSGEASGAYDRMVLFFDFGTNDNNVFYFDDIFLGAPGTVPGCTNPVASNYNSNATTDDGSCLYDVLFEVDMNCEDPASFTNVYLTGPYVGWCASCWPLSDNDGDGIYSNVFSIPEGTFEYKYQVDAWASQEDLVDDMLAGASCAPITDYANYANRTIDPAIDQSTLDTYGSCEACIQNLSGCTYPTATNYNPLAIDDDGSCVFGTDCPGDADGNGVVNVLDLVNVSSFFGNSCE